MSDMITRYNASKKPRPAEAHKIPELAVNFIDIQNEFAEGFTTFQKKNDPTSFTAKAMDYYTTQTSHIVIPPGFHAVEQGAQFNQWNPTHTYYTPGNPAGRNNN